MTVAEVPLLILLSVLQLARRTKHELDELFLTVSGFLVWMTCGLGAGEVGWGIHVTPDDVSVWP